MGSVRIFVLFGTAINHRNQIYKDEKRHKKYKKNIYICADSLMKNKVMKY